MKSPQTLDKVTARLQKIRTKRKAAETEATDARAAWLEMEKEALTGDQEVDPRARQGARERLRTAELQAEAAAAAETDLLRDLNESAQAERGRLQDQQNARRANINATLEREVPRVQGRLVEVLGEVLRIFGGRIGDQGFSFPVDAISGRPVFPPEIVQEVLRIGVAPAPDSPRLLWEEDRENAILVANYNPAQKVWKILRDLDALEPKATA